MGGSGLVVALVVVVVLAVIVGALAQFGYFYRRRRLFTHGVRGTAVVVDIRPISLAQRYSVTQPATDNVTVATEARPAGVLVAQRVPAGQYRVGEIVPVVQAPGRPDRLLLDRPDLERSAAGTYAPLLLVVLAPLVAVLGLQQLTGR